MQPRASFNSTGWCAIACAVAAFCSPVSAESGGSTASPAHAGVVGAEVKQGELGIGDWLMRMHEASRRRAYVGTFVVSSGSNLSSARIWHICDGEVQMERVESLTGAPRSTFRRNDQVITFVPGSKTAVAERRESLGLFPSLLRATDSSIAEFYSARRTGSERVAGFEADVVLLQPKDSLRYGYRVWSEKKTGLVVKLQTLGVDGRMLEQAAFSELQLDAPVSMGKLTQMMENTDGYRVEKPELVKTTAAAEGWIMRSAVAGFKTMSCYRRPGAAAAGGHAEHTMQWVFSDGLASVSLFVEAFDRRRHVQEGSLALGATNTLMRRVSDKAGDWWLTVVGEVPSATLAAFSHGLERKK